MAVASPHGLGACGSSRELKNSVSSVPSATFTVARLFPLHVDIAGSKYFPPADDFAGYEEWTNGSV